MERGVPGLEVAWLDGCAIVSGEVDAHNADALRAELDASADRPVRVDLSAVSFMDSSGLRVLIDADRRDIDPTTGHRIVLVDPSQPVRRLLEITGLDTHLHTETT